MNNGQMNRTLESWLPYPEFIAPKVVFMFNVYTPPCGTIVTTAMGIENPKGGLLENRKFFYFIYWPTARGRGSQLNQQQFNNLKN